MPPACHMEQYIGPNDNDASINRGQHQDNRVLRIKAVNRIGFIANWSGELNMCHSRLLRYDGHSFGTQDRGSRLSQQSTDKNRNLTIAKGVNPYDCKERQPFANAITPVCVAGLQSIFALPPFDFIYVKRSTIIGCAEVSSVST